MSSRKGILSDKSLEKDCKFNMYLPSVKIDQPTYGQRKPKYAKYSNSKKLVNYATNISTLDHCTECTIGAILDKTPIINTPVNVPELAPPQTTATQTQAPVQETIEVQTEAPVQETIEVQTETPAQETIEVQTETPAQETIEVQTETVTQESIETQEQKEIRETQEALREAQIAIEEALAMEAKKSEERTARLERQRIQTDNKRNLQNIYSSRVASSASIGKAIRERLTSQGRNVVLSNTQIKNYLDTIVRDASLPTPEEIENFIAGEGN